MNQRVRNRHCQTSDHSQIEGTSQFGKQWQLNNCIMPQLSVKGQSPLWGCTACTRVLLPPRGKLLEWIQIMEVRGVCVCVVLTDSFPVYLLFSEPLVLI